LPLSEDVQFEKISASELLFSWNPGKVSGGYADDQVMLLAYNIEKEDEVNSGNAFYSLTGQFRKTGSDTLSIPADNYSPNKTYHLYVAFSAADRSSQSDSIYLGTVEM